MRDIILEFYIFCATVVQYIKGDVSKDKSYISILMGTNRLWDAVNRQWSIFMRYLTCKRPISVLAVRRLFKKSLSKKDLECALLILDYNPRFPNLNYFWGQLRYWGYKLTPQCTAEGVTGLLVSKRGLGEVLILELDASNDYSVTVELVDNWGNLHKRTFSKVFYL